MYDTSMHRRGVKSRLTVRMCAVCLYSPNIIYQLLCLSWTSIIVAMPLCVYPVIGCIASSDRTLRFSVLRNSNLQTFPPRSKTSLFNFAESLVCRKPVFDTNMTGQFSYLPAY